MRIPVLVMILGVVLMPQFPGDRPFGPLHQTRSPVMARHGAIATSQPLATAAGLRVLESGGNAIDAAVTAAAVLTVVEPTMNGIGGDLFAMVYDPKTKSVRGLNASGRAGSRATLQTFQQQGLTRIPIRGPLSITVPGVVDGWNELLKKYGTITLAQALQPAIGYARDGFAVSPIIAGQWKEVEKVLARDPDTAATFLPGGKAPEPGDVFSNPRLAASLEKIAAGGRDVFYKGEIAKAIADDMQRRGGLITLQDLAAHHSDWIDPISTTYRGYDVFELPPNTQGATALEILNLMEGFDLKALGHNTAPYLERFVEAKRIAFADRDAWIGDPRTTPQAAIERMISKDYAAARRREINPDHAAASYQPLSISGAGPDDEPHPVGNGDTVYLTAADDKGHAVSLIESLFETFGSGLVAGDTGITLQDRGTLFSLTPGHPDQVAPGKRPFHTLIPAMVTKDGSLWLTFGVMGGDMQAQAHAQVLANLIDFGMNIQEAGEAPRFRHTANGLALESAIDQPTRDALTSMGYHIIQMHDAFGGFQGILIDPRTHVMMAGSDPRKDGMAAGW